MNSSFFKTLIHSVLLGKIYFTYLSSFQCTIKFNGGPEWTRTTDLTLIRRAL